MGDQFQNPDLVAPDRQRYYPLTPYFPPNNLVSNGGEIPYNPAFTAPGNDDTLPMPGPFSWHDYGPRPQISAQEDSPVVRSDDSQPWGTTTTLPNYTPAGGYAPVNLYNYTPTADGTYLEDPPGQQAPPEDPQINSPKPLTAAELAYVLQTMRSGSTPPASQD